MHEWLEEESPSYRTTAKTPDIASPLEVVRFARNRGVHDPVAISDPRTGLTFPLRFDLSFGPKWLPGAAFKPRHKDAKGLAAYELSLAGCPFPSPLDEAADFVIRGALPYGSPPKWAAIDAALPSQLAAMPSVGGCELAESAVARTR